MLLDPDAGGIPSQFPVQEDTQFCQILREALDFFGIEESQHEEYFLVDYKTRKCDFFLYGNVKLIFLTFSKEDFLRQVL